MILFIFPLLVVFTSCGKIPSEASELSAELGNRISEIEQAHMNLLHRFFDEKRGQTDKFVFDVWLPIAAREILVRPGMENLWQEVVDSDDPQDRIKYVLEIAPKIQGVINAKRNELHDPLDKLEKLTERKLRATYLQARAINNSLTSFLTSASKVERNRERLLEVIGLTDTNQIMDKVVDEVGSAVNVLSSEAQKAEAAVDTTEAFIKKLEKLADSL